MAQSKTKARSKETYVKKMELQIADWTSKIEELEGQEGQNEKSRQEMATLEQKIETTSKDLENLAKNETSWPESAFGISADYKKMKESVNEASKEAAEK